MVLLGQGALLDGGQAMPDEQKTVVNVMKKQIQFSSQLAQCCTSVPLVDCLAHRILTQLIK